MNDPELDQLLKSAAPPARDDAYWREFPAQVRRSLRGASAQPLRMGNSTWTLFWKLGLAGACATVAALLLLKFTNPKDTGAMELGALRKCYQELAAMFPRQLQAVVLESGQFRLQVSGGAEVPDSPPLVVRICHAARCATLVTFSGQQVEVFGRKFEVLENGRGGFIFLGQEGVWMPGQAPVGDEWRFEAAGLEGRL